MQLQSYFCPYIFGHKVGVLKSKALFQVKVLQVARFKVIDLFHNGGQIKYSFVLMLISPTSLPTTSTFQKNICFKMRAVGLINCH